MSVPIKFYLQKQVWAVICLPLLYIGSQLLRTRQQLPVLVCTVVFKALRDLCLQPFTSLISSAAVPCIVLSSYSGPCFPQICPHCAQDTQFLISFKFAQMPASQKGLPDTLLVITPQRCSTHSWFVFPQYLFLIVYNSMLTQLFCLTFLLLLEYMFPDTVTFSLFCSLLHPQDLEQA